MATTKLARMKQQQRKDDVGEVLDRLLEGHTTVESLRRENWDMTVRIEINRDAIRRFKNDYPELLSGKLGNGETNTADPSV